MAYKIFEKDPDAKLDYGLDWSAWLDGDTITASTWTVDPSGLTLSQGAYDATTAAIWAEDGVVGRKYNLTNHITTAAGRQTERTFSLLIKEQ